MLVYTLFIVVVAVLLYVDYATNLKVTYEAKSVNINHLAIYAVFLAIIVFGGLRYEIGYDYPKYLAGFLYDSELEKWEPFFNASVYLFREVNFGLDSQMLFLSYTVVTIAVLHFSLKALTPHYRLSILLYLLIPALFLNTFSILRQGISMVILLYALQYLTININKRKYLLFGLVAFLFHYASIFIVVTYLLLERYFNKTYSWITYMVVIIASYLLNLVHFGKFILLIMPGKFGAYVNYEMDVNILKLLVVNLLFIFLMLQKKQFVKTRLDRFLLNSMFISVVLFNIFADFVYVTRIAQYFQIAEIIIVPLYIFSFRSSVKRYTVLVVFLVYYMFNFEYALYRDIKYPGSRPHFLVPYNNYIVTDIKSDKQKYQQQWVEFYKQIGLIK